MRKKRKRYAKLVWKPLHEVARTKDGFVLQLAGGDGSWAWELYGQVKDGTIYHDKGVEETRAKAKARIVVRLSTARFLEETMPTADKNEVPFRLRTTDG